MTNTISVGSLERSGFPYKTTLYAGSPQAYPGRAISCNSQSLRPARQSTAGKQLVMNQLKPEWICLNAGKFIRVLLWVRHFCPCPFYFIEKRQIFIYTSKSERLNRGVDMKTIYDIQQLLKRFGTIIYVGNRLSDLELMEGELRELYVSKLIEQKEFHSALLLLRSEMEREKHKQDR